MAARSRLGVAWACALAILVQTLAGAIVAGRAAAAQAAPWSGIPICGAHGPAGGAGTPDGPESGHGLCCSCCIAGCCPAAVAVILPQQAEIPPTGIAAAAPGLVGPPLPTPPQRIADRFQARAPPLPL